MTSALLVHCTTHTPAKCARQSAAMCLVRDAAAAAAAAARCPSHTGGQGEAGHALGGGGPHCAPTF